MTSVDLLQAVARADARPARGPLGPLLVAALALAVAATTAYALAVNGVDQRQAQLEAVSARAQAAEAEVGKLAEFVAFEARAKQQVAAVAGLSATRFRWERALDDLTRVLPADANVASINASLTAGSGGGALRSARDLPAISLKGCLGSQGRVPELVSRLETMRGVSEVALASSGADEGGDGATCAGANAPGFDLVVFLGGPG
jgi:Tfp pilus assembly protein PilN